MRRHMCAKDGMGQIKIGMKEIQIDIPLLPLDNITHIPGLILAVQRIWQTAALETNELTVTNNFKLYSSLSG